MIKKFFILTFFISSFIFSNCTDIEIIENNFNDSIIGIYLSAIDLNTGSSTTPIFDYSIIVPDNQLCDSFNINYTIEIFSPELGFNSNFIFAEGGFTISDIPDNVNNIQFKNTDLTFSTDYLPCGAKIEMNPGIIVNANNSSIQSVIMQSGKIPNGTYTFRFSHANGDASISRTIDIYEPITFNLISPGGDITEIDENFISSSFPVFQWNSDPCPKCKIGIRVSEYNEDKHSSPFEALNDISSLPIGENEKYFFINSLSNNTFQYPFDNALDLEFGNKYVWQLVRQYNTTQGEVNNYSEIFAFNIKDLTSAQSSSNLSDQLNREKLILILGESKFQQLFSNGGELSDFFISNIEIKNNGSSLSSSDLEIMIEKIKNEEIKIKSYQVK